MHRIIFLLWYQVAEIAPPTATGMSLERMRTLLALLLKKISTPVRLRNLGFGSRLIGKIAPGI